MKRTPQGFAVAPRRGWLTVFSSTVLAGCAVTAPPPDQPTAVQSPAPGPARVAQIGFGSAAEFVRCVPATCPRPTPKTLARRRPAVDQTALPGRSTGLQATTSPPEQPRSLQGAEAGTLATVAHAQGQAAMGQVSAGKEQRGPAGTIGQQVVTILFTPASTRIGPAGYARILAAPVLGATRMVVHGHADPTGNTRDNLRLARNRAQAVVALLRATHPSLRHVRIDVVGGGKCCGTDAQSSATSHARQRSVEIVIERQDPDP